MSIVSVIIPFYNTQEYILKAINSIINQTYKNWELILIDDFSTDKSYEIVYNYINELIQKDNNYKNKFKLYQNKKNYGVYVSLNIGINKTNGDYICRLDSDDELNLQTLEKCVKILDINKNYDIVHYKYTTGKYIVYGEICLFYRKKIIQKLGYYDSVRFGADTEYRKRTYTLYHKKIFNLNEILYKYNKRLNSLTTSNDTGNLKIRSIYQDSYINYYKKVRFNKDKLYISFPLKTRLFQAPECMIVNYGE
jgi:glycosyltransferase involved in cell wall biosynthesis